MSAFIVNDIHIATIVHHYAKLKGLDEEHKQALADNLLAKNIRSVNHRYREDTPIDACDISEWSDVSYGDLLSLCDCLDYQSCEYPEYTEDGEDLVLKDICAAFEEAQGNPRRSGRVWSI